jgi:hypothetical protein
MPEVQWKKFSWPEALFLDYLVLLFAQTTGNER